VAQVEGAADRAMFLHQTHLHQLSFHTPIHLLIHNQSNHNPHIIRQHHRHNHQRTLHTKLQWKTGIAEVMELVILALAGPGLVVIAEVAVAPLVVTVAAMLAALLDQLKS
jgi:hypothetical protein